MTRARARFVLFVHFMEPVFEPLPLLAGRACIAVARRVPAERVLASRNAPNIRALRHSAAPGTGTAAGILA